MGFSVEAPSKEYRRRHSPNSGEFYITKAETGQSPNPTHAGGHPLTTLHLKAVGRAGAVSILFGVFLLCGPWAADRAGAETFDLKTTVQSALDANLGLKAAGKEVDAARAITKIRRSEFLPTFSASYQYQRVEDDDGVVPEDQYTFVGSISQPLFDGFSRLNRFRIARLGLDAAKLADRVKRQDIIFGAKELFYTILKARKLVDVAQQAAVQLEAHKNVAHKFYKVGMTPLNDFLEAEVELANARQALITARNRVEIAKSNLNRLLHRSVNAPLDLADGGRLVSFGKDLEFCLDAAEANRLEMKIAQLQVDIARREKDLGKAGYYPSVDLEGNYYRRGDEWDVDGGPGIGDKSSWDVAAVARWNFFEWGKTYYTVEEKQNRLTQARYEQQAVRDQVLLEVKQAYLNTQEAEQNILTVRQAVEQARENFRISEERFKGQVATSTDVLDAQTLLTRTMSSYYNALYDFKIFKAALFRAMGLEVLE